MEASLSNPYRKDVGKRVAQDALDRGEQAGFRGWAIYHPGTDVRCPSTLGRNGHVSAEPCGGYLHTSGPESATFVRVYEERRFNERRRAARDNRRCPRCEIRLEVEDVLTNEAVKA